MDEAILKDSVLRRMMELESEMAAIGERLQELQLRHTVLEEVLEDTVSVDVREEVDENPTVTELILRVIGERPGLPSRMVARLVTAARGESGTSTKTVQTIIGQLLRRNPPPITKDEDGCLYPLQERKAIVLQDDDDFRDFPVLQGDESDYPF